MLDRSPSETSDFGLTRRALIVKGAGGAASLSLTAALLSACGGQAASSTSSAAATPKRGGVVTLGIITGGSSETLDPKFAINNPDLARLPNLYNPLFRVGEDIRSLVPMLALEALPRKGGTLWTFKLRDGVVWHNGKPFTAEDVVYTMRGWQDKTHLFHGTVASLVDFTGIRSPGKLEVEVPLLTPVAQFPSLLTLYNAMIVQAGSTSADLKRNPVGTGPFKFVSFTPGNQSVFAANRDYWEEGRPYVDRLVVDSSFTDETARYNALLSGAINVSGSVPGTFAKQQGQGIQFLTSEGSNSYLVTMRVDKGQFVDNRVRQAMRLLANRAAIVEQGLDGFGTVANDLQGAYTQYFASDLHREQDTEQARALLKQAGQENISVVIPIAPAAPGFVECATVYAAQAKAAGVNVSVKPVPAANYFSPSGGYLTRPVGLDVAASSWPSLTFTYQFIYSRDAQYNATHWGFQPGGLKAQALLQRAVGELDPTKAAELWREVQLLQFNQGGALVYANASYIDAARDNVRGLKTTKAGYLNNWRLLDGWVE